MPNHVSTNLVITGPKLDVERFVNAVSQGQGQDNTFSFQNVRPMPKALFGTCSPVKIQTAEEIAALWDVYNTLKAEGKLDAWLLSADKLRDAYNTLSLDGKLDPLSLSADKPWGIGVTKEQYDALMAEHGSADWYSWCNTNWGTKWDAYDATGWDIADGDNGTATATIGYQTAWSPATEFFLFASAKYPTLSFWQQVADEGGGFVGEQTFEAGEVNENFFGWNSKDGKETREALGCYCDDDEDDSDPDALIDPEVAVELLDVPPIPPDDTKVVPLPFGTYRN